jgi:cytohesin
VVLVGCGESQYSVPPAESKSEPTTAKAPDISIHDAAKKGKIEAVKQHLAAGVDVNAKNVGGGTPLHYAMGKIEIAELLIAKGADVNARDAYGGTPLHYAARKGLKEVVELLIANGADVNAKAEDGSTPLHHAALWGHKEIAELLIDKGANVNAKEKEGITPLDVAEKVEDYHSPEQITSKKETADLLRKHGGKTKKELEAAGN